MRKPSVIKRQAACNATARREVSLDASGGKLEFYKYNPETGREESVNPAELKRFSVNPEPEPYTPKGRKLRKAFERPRPDLPSDAPANRTRRPIALTLPPDLVEELNRAAKAQKTNRTALIERAIRIALKL